MGRSRKIQVGRREYRPRQIDNPQQLKLIDTEPELREKLATDSAVSATIRERGLAYKDARTQRAQVNREKVKQEIQSIRAAIVEHRQTSRDYTQQQAGQVGRGLTARQEFNATDREYRTRAFAVEVAARAGGIELDRADKRTLSQAKEGFFTAVYGKKGQYIEGTTTTKRSGGSRYSDPSAKARAAEQSERLAEYRGQIGRQSTKGSLNPFSRGNQRPAVSNPRRTSYPPPPTFAAPAGAEAIEF